MADDSTKRSKIIKNSLTVPEPGDPAVDDYIKQYSMHMVKEVARYSDKIEGQYGEAFARVLLNQFLTYYVANIVFKKLNLRPKGVVAGVDILKHNTRMFTECKMDLQEAIAAGVGGAIAKYSGQSIEYVCQIKAVAEPINKQPC